MPKNINYSYILLFSLLLLSCGRSPDRVSTAAGTPAAESPVALEEVPSGDYLFERYTCMACHSLEGKEMYGPRLDSLFMKEVRVVRDGELLMLTADRAYLERSIMDPDYERVQGYEKRIMPKPEMPERDLKLLVDYIISVSQ